VARRKRARGTRSLGGVFILVLAGIGIWIGAGLVDGDGSFLPRTLEHEEPERAIPAPGERIRVEVLNAGGVRGMASRVTDELRDRGFDVVFYGNAASFGEEASQVLHRAGPEEAAREVARVLGIELVRSEPDTTLLVEVTVLVGSGWQPRREPEAAAPGRTRD
jgi:hypothetical protein